MFIQRDLETFHVISRRYKCIARRSFMMPFEFLNVTTLSYSLIPALENSATQIRLCSCFPYVPLCVNICYFHLTCLFDMLLFSE